MLNCFCRVEAVFYAICSGSEPRTRSALEGQSTKFLFAGFASVTGDDESFQDLERIANEQLHQMKWISNDRVDV